MLQKPIAYPRIQCLPCCLWYKTTHKYLSNTTLLIIVSRVFNIITISILIWSYTILNLCHLFHNKTHSNLLNFHDKICSCVALWHIKSKWKSWLSLISVYLLWSSDPVIEREWVKVDQMSFSCNNTLENRDEFEY